MGYRFPRMILKSRWSTQVDDLQSTLKFVRIRWSLLLRDNADPPINTTTPDSQPLFTAVIWGEEGAYWTLVWELDWSAEKTVSGASRTEVQQGMSPHLYSIPSIYRVPRYTVLLGTHLPPVKHGTSLGTIPEIEKFAKKSCYFIFNVNESELNKWLIVWGFCEIFAGDGGSLPM